MISMSKWIENKLNEGHDFSFINSEDGFALFMKETGIHKANYESYRRIARDKRPVDVPPQKSFTGVGTSAAKYPVEEEVDVDVIAQMIEDMTVENGRMVNSKDIEEIAKEANVTKTKIYSIPNLREIIENAFTVANLEVESEKKLSRLRDDYSKLKKKYDKMLKEENSNDAIIAAIEEKAANYAPEPLAISERSYIENRDDDVALHVILSDLHYGKHVDFMQVVQTNYYDREVARNRLSDYCEKIIALGYDRKISNLHLSIIGDMIEGVIQEHNEIRTEAVVIQQTLEVQFLLTEFIKELAKHFQRIDVTTKPGNHGRDRSGKPQGPTENKSNFDNMIYFNVKYNVEGLVNSFIIQDWSYWINYVLDEVPFLEHHGHYFSKGSSNGYSPIPSTIGRNTAQIIGILQESENINELPWYTVCGHFHQLMQTKSFDGTPVYINGSLISNTTYAVNTIRKSESPKQTALVVHRKHGVLSQEFIQIDYHFDFEEKRKEAEEDYVFV